MKNKNKKEYLFDLNVTYSQVKIQKSKGA